MDRRQGGADEPGRYRPAGLNFDLHSARLHEAGGDGRRKAKENEMETIATRNKNGVTEYYRGTFLGLSVWSPAPWQSVEPETDSTVEVEHERIER